MTTASLAHTPAEATHPESPMARIIGRMRLAMARGRGRAMLHALDDRMLRDIGLTRADITTFRY